MDRAIFDRRQVAALAMLCVVCFTIYSFGAKGATSTPMPDDQVAYAAPLAGVRIVLDPGHGGYDQGCKGYKGTLEAPLNLDVSLRLQAELEQMGAYVVLTRVEDVSLVDPKASGNKKRQDMALRKAVIEQSQADIVLSIHMNDYTSTTPSGALTYYIKDCEEGLALASAIQGEFVKQKVAKDKIAKVGDFFMLGMCQASALVECGFLSNPAEEAKLNTQEYRQAIAQTIAQGVLRYWHPI